MKRLLTLRMAPPTDLISKTKILKLWFKQEKFGTNLFIGQKETTYWQLDPHQEKTLIFQEWG